MPFNSNASGRAAAPEACTGTLPVPALIQHPPLNPGTQEPRPVSDRPGPLHALPDLRRQLR